MTQNVEERDQEHTQEHKVKLDSEPSNKEEVNQNKSGEVKIKNNHHRITLK